MNLSSPTFRPGKIVGKAGWMVRRLAVILLSVSTIASAASSAPIEPITFDLLEAVASDGSLPEDVQAVLRGAHGQTRASIRMAIPARVSYPVTIEPGDKLRFGVAASANAFLVESPDLARAVQVRVVFRDADGEKVLYTRDIDLRRRSDDRGWFDEKIDLEGLAGRSGEITFETSSEEPDSAGITLVYWSNPRIGLRPPAPTAPNLLFVTIDCLRADHVGSYGYGRETTPNLDRLAGEGIRFANAFANAPMTLPSIPQIFTSRLFPTRDEAILTKPIGDASIPSAAFVNNAWIPLWLSQGKHASPPGTFDRIVSGELDAKEISDLAVTWLRSHPDERFALYLHYLDAHTPYRPPGHLIELFADPGYTGTLALTFDDEEGARTGRYERADQLQIIALYDAAIRYVDQELNRVLNELRNSGRYEDTLIVVSADHGEEFWDHGSFFHGQSLYEELLHIPLIVRLPGGKRHGTTIERTARGIDLAPSILDWMNLPVPEGFTGERLGTVLDKPGREVFATATQAQFPTRFALRRGDRKVIESIDEGRVESFRLGEDPGERNGDSPTNADKELLAELRELRRILRERGFQMRVVAAGTEGVELTLSSHPRSGTFLTLDRHGSKGSLRAARDGRKIDAQGPASGFGFRFDRRRDVTNLGGRDLVEITATRETGRQGDLEIRLGLAGRRATSAVVDLRAEDLETTVAPDCPPPATGTRLCLWRFPGEKPSELPVIENPALRERLRALGYVP